MKNLDATRLHLNCRYTTFGTEMSGRRFLSPKAKYGFNGKLKDNEDYGEGNAYDYGFRIYNPRLGRFLSEDPLSHEYPWFTPYQFSGNTPISAIDLDGLENIYINTNTDNKGECMEVVYTADDIATIMAGKKPEFKVHYVNSGKTTDQFEGPNKANENKVFQAIKPLLIKSGITQYMKNKPDNKEWDLEWIKNNYEVPAPTPKKPKLPKGDPKPIVPPLSIDFKGGSDEFKTPSQVDALVQPVAEYLIKNPKEKINLTGNTGVVGDPNAPTGAGKDVLDSPTYGGKFKTTGELMKARADAVKNYLVTKYKIDPSRISTSTGSQTQGEAGRTVGVDKK